MTPIEILHSIVDAEAKACSVKKEAAELRDHFEEYVGANIKKVRTEQYSLAECEIAEAKERENRIADETVERLDKKLKDELAAVAEDFKRKKDDIVSKVFKMAVDTDA